MTADLPPPPVLSRCDTAGECRYDPACAIYAEWCRHDTPGGGDDTLTRCRCCRPGGYGAACAPAGATGGP